MNKINIFDGAFGTMLQKAGLQEGECPELYNIEHPDIVESIHQAYLKSGSTIITTNTFGASSLKLADYALQNRTKEINIAGVSAAKNAIATINPNAKIAGSMGPTGTFIAPLGQITFDEIYEAYKEQASALLEAGVDFLLIETIIDIQEMRAALLAALDARRDAGLSSEDVKIICQFSFSDDGRTVTGTPPDAAAVLLESMGADIIGINCSLGPEQFIPLIKKIASVTDLPISAQPNAGLPVLIGRETVFPLSPEEMASFIPDMLDAGVTYIGACCGSTPEHISNIKKAALSHTPAPRLKIKPFTAFTSRTSLLRVGHTEKPIIIGERINPTGRKKLAEEILNGNFITVKRDAIAQVESGASMLDVNMGVAGIDQAAAMERAIHELSMLVDVPLVIDTLDPAAMESALKAYPGRALINSVNAEDEQIKNIMPLAKRYGSALLCLPLGSGNLPETAEERCEIAKEIVLKAYSYGLRPQDLLLDPLVLTLAAGDNSAKETLKTLSIYKELFGFPTVMGLSNISFGLPQRPYLNSQFLTMAMSNGLTCPILNPLNPTVIKAFTAANTLLGHDPAAMNFINTYGQEPDLPAATASSSVASVVSPSPELSLDPSPSTDASLPNYIKDIRLAVERGEKESVSILVENALRLGADPLEITESGLSGAMEIVGEKFGSGKMFLPQVMLAAESMQSAFQTIKKVLPDRKTERKGTVVLATVKGDIHDLGKNIVGALLENNGYTIIDLGKDVPADDIIRSAKENHAEVVGICSLMTTTLPQINVTIQAVRKAGLDVKVIVGGAVVSQKYADEAGADRYVKDGIAAVGIVNALLKK